MFVQQIGGTKMSLIEDIISNLPKVITIQNSLREDGPIEESRIIRVSSTLGDFCNDVKNISYNFNIDLLQEARYALEDGNDEDKIDFYKTVEEKNRNFRERKLNNSMKSAELELILPYFSSDIVIGHIFSDKFNYSSEIKPYEYTKTFFEYVRPVRLLSNRKRHQDQQDFSQSNEEIRCMLEFLNQDDFEILIQRIAIGACFIHSCQSRDREENISIIFNDLVGRVETVLGNRRSSSLAKYKEKLDSLFWGPANYRRDENVIREAHTALEKYPVIAFYGLGGVGKTALAEKLMFDIINNDEPYSHIVTHSSKVGSDQKTVNTISPQTKGDFVETDLNVTAMESSLINEKGIMKIGDLRTILLKMYRELKGESGRAYGDKKLKSDIFSELKKPETRLLLVIDNYEDVEDNMDDSDVHDIRTEIKNFLEEFSNLPQSVNSRIIITTRSTPLPIAHGIEVKHLTKEESTSLFLSKIKFRELRVENKNQKLRLNLSSIHDMFNSNLALNDALVNSFDLWESGDNHKAHPLLVLLAAEDVTRNDLEHITDIIKEWGAGEKGQKIIEYCVSKTLGSFAEYEQEVLKILVNTTSLNSELTLESTRNKIESHDVNKSNFSNEEQRKKFTEITDDDLIDLMIQLSDRTFVRARQKRNLLWNSKLCLEQNRF